MISQRQTIRALAQEVRHLTAPMLPRVSKPDDSVEFLHLTLARLRELVDHLLLEVGTLRGAVARVELHKAGHGAPEVSVRRLDLMLKIAERICEPTGCSLDELRSPCRDSRLVIERHAVIRALHEEGFSLSAIGRFLNRDHTTIRYALRKHPKSL